MRHSCRTALAPALAAASLALAAPAHAAVNYTYTQIDPFGATGVSAYGINSINNSGQIVGEYQDPSSGHIYGFLATPDASATPEPSQSGMLALMGIGLGGLLLRARKRRLSA